LEITHFRSSPHPAHAGADIDAHALSSSARGSAGRNRRPNCHVEQAEKANDYLISMAKSYLMTLLRLPTIPPSEVDEGKLQLSVYTMKEGKFSEVLVDYTNGKVVKAEPITEGDDLAAANLQSAAMTDAKITLKEAVDKTVAQSAKNIRAVRAVPSLKDGHPVASIDVLNYNQIKAIQQPLD
jgi:hypothetical protein